MLGAAGNSSTAPAKKSATFSSQPEQNVVQRPSPNTSMALPDHYSRPASPRHGLPRKLLLRENRQDADPAHFMRLPDVPLEPGVCVATDHVGDFDESALSRPGGNDDPAAPSGTDARRSGTDASAASTLSSTCRATSRRLPERRSIWRSNAGVESELAVMSTLATPIRDRRQLEDPACVKVVSTPPAGRCTSPQRNPLIRGNGRRPIASDPPASIQHVVATPIAANSCSTWRPRRVPMGTDRRLNSYAFSTAAIPFWSAYRRSHFRIDTPDDYRGVLWRSSAIGAAAKTAARSNVAVQNR